MLSKMTSPMRGNLFPSTLDFPPLSTKLSLRKPTATDV